MMQEGRDLPPLAGTIVQTMSRTLRQVFMVKIVVEFSETFVDFEEVSVTVGSKMACSLRYVRSSVRCSFHGSQQII